MLRICLLIFAFFVFGGCSSAKIVSQKDIFLKENPELRSKYVRLDITSFGAYENYLYDEYSSNTTILRILREKFPSNKKLVEFINELEDIWEADYNDRLEHMKDISKEDILPEDEIYLFEFFDQDKTEYGILILRNNKIRKRFVYMTAGPGYGLSQDK